MPHPGPRQAWTPASLCYSQLHGKASTGVSGLVTCLGSWLDNSQAKAGHCGLQNRVEPDSLQEQRLTVGSVKQVLSGASGYITELTILLCSEPHATHADRATLNPVHLFGQERGAWSVYQNGARAICSTAGEGTQAPCAVSKTREEPLSGKASGTNREGKPAASPAPGAASGTGTLMPTSASQLALASGPSTAWTGTVLVVRYLPPQF